MDMHFDFEKYTPPVINEKMLTAQKQRRDTVKQIIVLKIASALTAICVILFAFFLSMYSVAAAIICIVVLCFSLIGEGIISVVTVSQLKNNNSEYLRRVK